VKKGMNRNNGRAEDKRLMLGLLILLLVTVLAAAGIFISMLVKQNPIFAAISVLILSVFATAVVLFILVTLSSIVMVYSGKENAKIAGRVAKKSLDIMLNPVLGIGRLVGLDTERIQRAYAGINNRVVYSNKPDLSTEDILILLPHCIQNSKCRHRLNEDIRNCAGCGKCSVSDMVELAGRLGVKVKMVPGGTLARKTVAEVKPKAIVAVACERDLCSGIRDTSFIPVIGILNERPYGPCRDTKVDVKKVEDAVKFLCNRR